MNTILHRSLRLAAVLVTAVLLTSAPVFAQTSLTTTTLSAAITDTTGTGVQVASATGITAPGTGANLVYIYVDWELMQVRTVTSTTLTVLRGSNGTRAMLHAANSVVYVVPPLALTTVDQGGVCIAANQLYLPIINVRNGNVWNCAATSSGAIWQAWNSQQIMETKPRTVVAGTAYTILPTDYLVVLSTTIGSQVAAKSFTLPSHLGLAGKQIVIKDESGGVNGTTSIVLVGTIDGTNSGTATVIQLKTAFMSVGLEAGSGGWFTIWCWGGGGSATISGVAGCR